MELKLEMLVVPVSDVERAKGFYAETLGFDVDHDTSVGVERLIQLTPRGSACSLRPSRGGDALDNVGFSFSSATPTENSRTVQQISGRP